MSYDPAIDTHYVTDPKLACDGGEGALGHPRVFLQIDPDIGMIDCPYCGKKYILKRENSV